MNDDQVTAIRQYARCLSVEAGDQHHVVSALGAWLVLALCAGLAPSRHARSELNEILGMDAETAFALACELLVQTHPLVGAAAGLWYHSASETSQVKSWSARLPSSVDTGEVPTQREIDGWSERQTLGLIKRFPMDLSADVTCILASALATRVSWEMPFEVVPASELAPSAWSSTLKWVLRAPQADHRHQQFLVDAPAVGHAAVHLARARGGLLVGSVIAADEGAPPSKVLESAHEIVTAEAQTSGSTTRISLFDLPLGDGPLWSLTEESVQTTAHNGREERVVSVLPAWSAETELDLRAESLGFAAAARILADAFANPDWQFTARQAAVARYSAIGFEAAAVTGLMMRMSAPVLRPGARRVASVRFARPYAVVAAACDGMNGRSDHPTPAVWRGLPIFSAWVTTPSDADLAPAVR